jgi:hypothetical protein
MPMCLYEYDIYLTISKDKKGAENGKKEETDKADEIS